MKNEYIKRQTYMMSNLGLFYIIIIALFAVPLLGTFVVVFIKGVLDFRYFILAGGIVAGAFIIFYAGKFFMRAGRKIQQEGLIALQQARRSNGQPMQIEFLGGMVSLSCGGSQNKKLAHDSNAPLLLTQKSPEASDPIQQLKDLAALKDQGIIDDEEFLILKKQLIQSVCEK